MEKMGEEELKRRVERVAENTLKNEGYDEKSEEYYYMRIVLIRQMIPLFRKEENRRIKRMKRKRGRRR